MRIAVASDHAGLSIKTVIREFLIGRGHAVDDLGTFTTEPVDYPEYAAAVARAIHAGTSERGVLICGSGVGASVAANKHHGIRAGLCHDTYSAHQGVEHDDMNVLVLGGASLARRSRASWCSRLRRQPLRTKSVTSGGSRRFAPSKRRYDYDNHDH